MHPTLEQLLRDIEAAADRVERHVNDLMIEFPMPSPTFPEEFGDGDARNALYDLATALNWSYFNPYFKETCWISASATCWENYRKICEFHNVEKPTSLHIEKLYGDSSVALRIAMHNVEGGLHGIVKTMVQNLKEKHIESVTTSAAKKYWSDENEIWSDGLYGGASQTSKSEKNYKALWDKKTEQIQSYKDKYEAFLPTDFMLEGNMMLALKFGDILANHYKLARRIKGLI